MIELEYQAFIQYFYQSLLFRGYNTIELSQFLATEADVELGHAKLLAEVKNLNEFRLLIPRLS